MESSHGMVTKTSVESTVPCVVTNPNIRVTLHRMDSGEAIGGTYTPSEGFKALLEDRAYVCRGELDGKVKESQSFNVLSIAGRCLGDEGQLISAPRQDENCDHYQATTTCS